MKNLEPIVRRGYWCECWTTSPTTGNAPALLASFDATSAMQAVRWIKVALRTIVSALEPDAADRAWTWLNSGYVASIRDLVRDEACTFTVTHFHPLTVCRDTPS
ncbi:hypothetical protein ABZ746_02080 [Streptomyces sp. NPDC020096]